MIFTIRSYYVQGYILSLYIRAHKDRGNDLVQQLQLLEKKLSFNDISNRSTIVITDVQKRKPRYFLGKIVPRSLCLSLSCVRVILYATLKKALTTLG